MRLFFFVCTMIKQMSIKSWTDVMQVMEEKKDNGTVRIMYEYKPNSQTMLIRPQKKENGTYVFQMPEPTDQHDIPASVIRYTMFDDKLHGLENKDIDKLHLNLPGIVRRGINSMHFRLVELKTQQDNVTRSISNLINRATGNVKYKNRLISLQSDLRDLFDGLYDFWKQVTITHLYYIDYLFNTTTSQILNEDTSSDFWSPNVNTYLQKTKDEDERVKFLKQTFDKNNDFHQRCKDYRNNIVEIKNGLDITAKDYAQIINEHFEEINKICNVDEFCDQRLVADFRTLFFNDRNFSYGDIRTKQMKNDCVYKQIVQGAMYEIWKTEVDKRFREYEIGVTFVKSMYVHNFTHNITYKDQTLAGQTKGRGIFGVSAAKLIGNQSYDNMEEFVTDLIRDETKAPWDRLKTSPSIQKTTIFRGLHSMNMDHYGGYKAMYPLDTQTVASSLYFQSLRQREDDHKQRRLLVLAPTGTGKSMVYINTICQCIETPIAKVKNIYVLLKSSTYMQQIRNLLTHAYFLEKISKHRSQTKDLPTADLCQECTDTGAWSQVYLRSEDADLPTKFVRNGGTNEGTSVHMIKYDHPGFGMYEDLSIDAKVAFQKNRVPRDTCQPLIYEMLQESNMIIMDEIDDIVKNALLLEDDDKNMDVTDVSSENEDDMSAKRQKTKDTLMEIIQKQRLQKNVVAEKWKKLESLVSAAVWSTYINCKANADPTRRDKTTTRPPNRKTKYYNSYDMLRTFLRVMSSAAEWTRSLDAKEANEETFKQKYEEKVLSVLRNIRLQRLVKTDTSDIQNSEDFLTAMMELYVEYKAAQEKQDDIDMKMAATIWKRVKNEMDSNTCGGLLGLTATLGTLKCGTELLEFFSKESNFAISDDIKKLFGENTKGDQNEKELQKQLIKLCEFGKLNYEFQIPEDNEIETAVRQIVDSVNMTSLYKPNFDMRREDTGRYDERFPLIDFVLDLSGYHISHYDIVLIPGEKGEELDVTKMRDEAHVVKFKIPLAQSILNNISSLQSEIETTKITSDALCMTKILVITKSKSLSDLLADEINQSKTNKTNKTNNIMLYTKDKILEFNQTMDYDRTHVLISSVSEVGRGVDFKNVKLLLKIGFFTYEENIQIDGRVTRIDSITAKACRDIKIKFLIPSVSEFSIGPSLLSAQEQSKEKLINCYLKAAIMLDNYAVLNEKIMSLLYTQSPRYTFIKDRIDLM